MSVIPLIDFSRSVVNMVDLGGHESDSSKVHGSMYAAPHLPILDHKVFHLPMSTMLRQHDSRNVKLSKYDK